jgi:arabinogalactan endo-1,4-beta-galactosidase
MKLPRLFSIAILLCCVSMMQAQKYVGGDLSVLLKYEEQKATYLDKDGKAIADLLTFVKQQGWNTVRVRLFDDPSKDTDKNVCQDLAYVKKLGKRIKDAGLYFMLDFHYSDTWADPGQQTIPKSWSFYSWYVEQSVEKYTRDCLEELVAAGATPDLIQIGNEISFGMLWGFNLDGKYEEWNEGCHLEATADWKSYTDKNWNHFANCLNAASLVCREECPKAKIIIHTEQCANNPTLDVAFFNRIKQYEIDYDIIGTSYYPYYKGPLDNLDKGLTQLETNFPDKEIQIVETGYPSKWAVSGTTYDYTAVYPYSHEGQRRYTADLITMLNKHPKVNGLSWWYAEANAKGCTGSLKEGWYNASLFNNETGRALPALYELKAFNTSTTGIQDTPRELQQDDVWYNLNGRRLDSVPHEKGLYIQNRQKILVK